MRFLIVCAALVSSLLVAAAREEDGVMLKLYALNMEYNDALGESTLLVDDYAALAAGAVTHINGYYDGCSLSRDIKPDNIMFLKISAACTVVNNILNELWKFREEERHVLFQPGGAVMAEEIPGFEPGVMVDRGDINARVERLNSLHNAIQALYAEIR